jgi:hypothetical protein
MGRGDGEGGILHEGGDISPFALPVRERIICDDKEAKMYVYIKTDIEI